MRPATLITVGVLLLAAAIPQANGQAVDSQQVSYTRKGADTCLSCHEDASTLAVFRTKHAVPSDSRGPFGHGQLQCESCHGPGDEHSGRVRRGQDRPLIPYFGSDATSDVVGQNSMCLECHKNDAGIGWHSGSHPVDEVSCASCHSSHSPTDPVLRTSTQAEVCFDCHQRQRSETLKAFSHPLFEGKMDCTGCHDVHGDNAASQLARMNVNGTCEQCHAEKRGPFLWEHAPVSEDCGLCHTPHGSNHPGMLTRRAPLLCQECHAEAGHPSFSYETDGLANNTPSQFLLGQSCMSCHSQVHGSNHPSGSKLAR